jgi:integrase
MSKLTKSIVESLYLPESGQKFIWDTELKGFGIRLTPTVKTYIVQSRVNGKNKRVTIGKHGPFTVQQARDKARDLLRAMSSGVNPQDEKKRKHAESVTLKDVVKSYISDRSLKPRTISDIHTHMQRSFNDWQNKRLVDITRNMVLVRFRELSESSKAQANQAFRILRSILNYARATFRPDDKPILPENPVQILSDAKVWNTVKPKNRRVATDKVGHAWNAVQEFRDDPVQTLASRSVADAVAFAMLTGARRNEVLELTWDRVDLEQNTWHLPDPKNHNPVTFPLSSQARELIDQRPRINEYVFANPATKTGHVQEPKGTMKKISEKCGSTISIHDLRRTFRAIAGECGIELYKTKLLMNHKLNQDVTISAYTETSDLRYLQPEIQKIGDWIERQGKIAASEKVVDLDQARKKAV